MNWNAQFWPFLILSISLIIVDLLPAWVVVLVHLIFNLEEGNLFEKPSLDKKRQQHRDESKQIAEFGWDLKNQDGNIVYLRDHKYRVRFHIYLKRVGEVLLLRMCRPVGNPVATILPEHFMLHLWGGRLFVLISDIMFAPVEDILVHVQHWEDPSFAGYSNNLFNLHITTSIHMSIY